MTSPAHDDPFITIDDLSVLATRLVAGLEKLRHYKHPLDVRRAAAIRREVIDMANTSSESDVLKAGARTYFFDLKKTKKDGKPFIIITESHFTGEGNKRERNSVMIFPEQATAFRDKVAAMVDKLG